MNEPLAQYSPGQLSPDTLRARLVSREGLLERRVTQLAACVETGDRPHMLFLGPRGIGKTHLLTLLHHQLRSELTQRGLEERARLAWLREEEWGATSCGKLLVRVLQTLARQYSDAELATDVERLFLSPDRLLERAGALLREWVGERLLFVFLENLDDLFHQFGRQGQLELRAYLQNHPFLVLVASAQTLADPLRRESFPFFGFFSTYFLKELTVEEAQELLLRLADEREDAALSAYMRTAEGAARVQAIHHLAGGNPRVYVALFEFLGADTLAQVTPAFLRLVSDLTPYYQARMGWLPPVQREIVALLCEGPGARPVHDIARRCFTTPGATGSELKKLREKGYVRPIPVGRESYYSLAEPLMRTCIEVKDHSGEPLRLLAEFLRRWYTPAELRARLTQSDGPTSSDHGYLSRALELQSHAEQTLLPDLDPVLVQAIAREDWPAALQLAELAVQERGSAYDEVALGFCLARSDRLVESVATLQRATARFPDHALAWFILGNSRDHLSRHGEALASLQHATELDPRHATARHNVASTLAGLGMLGEVQAAVERAMALDPGAVVPLAIQAEILCLGGSWSEGMAALERHLEACAAQRIVYPLDPDGQSFVLRRLLETTADPALWRERVGAWLAVCERHRVVGGLGQVVVRAIPGLFAPSVSDATAQAWLTLWQDLSRNQPELTLPVRLLSAAVEWRPQRDPRALLRLPEPERRVLEQVLARLPS